MSSIDFEHVTKRYADGFEAVNDLNLAIDDGEFMILIGPSGSGKSTALRMVAGLEDITEGAVRIGDEIVNDRAPKDRDIAMVFQSYALYPHMTVRENMGFALRLAKAPRDEIDRKVGEAARILGIEEQLDRKPAVLSGGQRQRVAMGRAIVRSPRAFLMDEPLSNLDAKLRVETRTEISRIQRQLGTTTIYVTHDQVEAMTLGDRIAVMRAGTLQQVGAPREIYDDPDNLFVAGFIGSPAMNFLSGRFDGGRLRTPIGDVAIPAGLRLRLESGPGGGERGVIVGIRPEQFEDARLVGDRSHGHSFRTRVDVLEALGSEYLAHFMLDAQQVPSAELDEVANDTGTAYRRRSRAGVPIVARLGAGSRVREGQEAELWVDTTQLYLFDHETGRSLLANDGWNPAQTLPPASATG
jgi:multiple sugar transport system ATP-binding protein